MRTTITAHSITGYEINASVDPNNPYIQIVRWNGPLNSWKSLAITSIGVKNGDVLAATDIGNTITVYKNGAQVLQATDSTYSTGSPGIGFYDNVDNNWTNFGFSNFSASNVGSGSSPPPQSGALTITAPGSATVQQNQKLAITGVGLSESPTTSGETFTATLSDTNGVLAATTGATGGGGTITSSNGGKTLTITGTLAQVNADLTTLTESEVTAGSDTITIKASDSNGGQAVSKSIAVTVTGPTGTNINGSYSTSFPANENPISEGGGWINGGTTGLDWGNVATIPGLAYGTSLKTLYADPTAILTGTWASNQEAQGTVKINGSVSGGSHEVELRLRTTITAHSITGYEINASVDPNNPYIQIVRWNGPLNSWKSLAITSIGVKNGDVLAATDIGNTITVYKNGAQVLQATDSTYSTGSPGIGFYDNVDNNWTNFGFSNFSASNVGSGSSPPPQSGALTITAPGSATVQQNQKLAITGVGLSESPTTSGETFTATLSDTNGVLAATTGVTGGGGTITSSNGGKTLTITGTLAQVNADLTTLTDTEATTGSDTITIKASDSNGGQVVSKSIAVTVTGPTGTNINGSYSTSFPANENPISEGGAWINGGTTGLDWGNVATIPGLAYGTSLKTLYADPTAILTGTWASNQEAQGTVKINGSVSGGAHEVELRLRTTITAHSITGYEINASVDPNNPYIQIVRWNGPLNSWKSLAITSIGVKNGDVLAATDIGNTITVYKNGAQVLQATDSTYSTGSPGIGFYDNVDNNWTNFGFSNFSASNVSTSNISASNVSASNISASNVGSGSTVDQDTEAEAPSLSISSSAITVTAGGSIALGIKAAPVDSDDRISVSISGVPGFRDGNSPERRYCHANEERQDLHLHHIGARGTDGH